MQLDLVMVPSLLTQRHVRGRTVIVFDVLRATTSMAAALAVGVREIFLHPTLDAARSAAGPAGADRLLCGEEKCLPPSGFDLGNSPGAFISTHAGRTMHLCTTNGTRALIAAKEAAALLGGALVNARAVASAAIEKRLDVTLLCAVTNGEIAAEDVLGAGAVTHALLDRQVIDFDSDGPLVACRLFEARRTNLRAALAETRGGRNVAAAGLAADIDFAARLDVLDVVGAVERTAEQGLIVKPLR